MSLVPFQFESVLELVWSRLRRRLGGSGSVVLVPSSWFRCGSVKVVPCWFRHGAVMIVPKWIRPGADLEPFWFRLGAVVVPLFHLYGVDFASIGSLKKRLAKGSNNGPKIEGERWECIP